MVADDTQTIDRLPMLSETERHQVLYEWNATEREYPRDKCVHELFEEQVAKTPEAVAVVYEEAELSYGELNARANRLAHYLRELGVGRMSGWRSAWSGAGDGGGVAGGAEGRSGYVPLDPGVSGGAAAVHAGGQRRRWCC